MRSPSQLCSIDTCERSALVICDCHNEYFCNDHFMEHTIQSDNGTTSDNDQSKNASLEKRSCFTLLNKWCRGIYQRVKRSQPKNTQQSEKTANQEQIELDQLKININGLDEDNHQSKILRPNLFPLERPYRSIQVEDKNCVSMACSNKYLLIEQKPNLCLFDRTLTIVKRIPWSYNHVDVCWSSVLDHFILITKRDIFTLDQNTMELEECSIPHHDRKEWLCAACSDTTLYLSTVDMSACLYEYTLLPSFEFVKEWQLIVICPLYESILTFSYGNEKLAFVICNAQTFQNRLDLHSSMTMEVLWTIPLTIIARCCSINNDQWIIINYLESQLLHISLDGKILQEYNDTSSPMNPIINAVRWGDDTIVTATIKSLNLHILS